jgi:serine/threonine protein kinase HipA of HipAB toxin-antitoxin module
MFQQVPGDRIDYQTAEEAAIALAQRLQVLDESQKAKADLFGDWNEPTSHLVESHGDFIDDTNQEMRSLQPVASGKARKKPDPFGGFSF